MRLNLRGEKRSGGGRRNKVDALNKFYPKVQPILMAFFRANHKTLSVQGQNVIQEVFNDVMLKVAEIYRKEILRDKFNLDLDLTEYTEWDDVPGKSFIQKFNPCEICGQVRVVHQCHIIPRNHGGADKADNYIILCANHHHLFDRHKLNKDEWERINWSTKAKEVQEYVFRVRHPRQQMHWKYRAPSIEGCQCGNTDFEVSFHQYEGDGNYSPPSVSRVLTCKSCEESYCDGNYYGDEFQWRWEFIQSRYVKSKEE